MELAGHGAIDFIPTNTDARVLMRAGIEGTSLVPVAVDGVYIVRHDESGADLLRGHYVLPHAERR